MCEEKKNIQKISRFANLSWDFFLIGQNTYSPTPSPLGVFHYWDSTFQVRLSH